MLGRQRWREHEDCNGGVLDNRKLSVWELDISLGLYANICMGVGVGIVVEKAIHRPKVMDKEGNPKVLKWALEIGEEARLNYLLFGIMVRGRKQRSSRVSVDTSNIVGRR